MQVSLSFDLLIVNIFPMKTFKTLLYILTLLFGTKAMTIETSTDIVFAWINNTHEIELITDHPEKIRSEDLQVLDNQNKNYNFKISNKTSDSVFLHLPDAIDNKKNYFIKTSHQKIYGYFTQDFIEANLNYKGPLGVKLDPSKKAAVFNLWSPTAESVTLIVSSPTTKKAMVMAEMERRDQGLWVGILDGQLNLEGLHYQYKIKAFGKEYLALDPYAKSMGAFDPKGSDRVGMGAIVLDPIKKAYRPLPSQKDDTNFIGMEVHVRDATISPNSPAPINLKGTYLGFINALDYYKDLGVTHLQLLPLQNYFTVNESMKAYQGAEVPRSELNYNWGYDPHNYFTPEGWFSTDASDPYARITELQKMNSEIHKKGMGVILDVVYNHVFAGDAFESAAPGMYLRRNRRGIVSIGTGAGHSVESRSVMARRLIVDSLKYWQDIFGIDGFRFDLMGFMDKETMREIRSSLHPETILYGEAWVFTDLPMSEATIKTDLPHELNISAFNDTSRDSYAGRNEGRGFVQGNFNENHKVRSGIVGGIKNHPQWDLVSQNDYDSFAENPLETLNYLTIHDGFTLWDKINLSVGGDFKKRLQIAKNAYAMLFTSQGRIVLQQGCEAGRSKPLQSNDPYPDRAHTSSVVTPENGISYFHENSYSSSDATNRFDWDRAREFEELRSYVKGLIEMRKAFSGLRLNEPDAIRNGVRFIPQNANGLLSYLINSEILVIHNSEPTGQAVLIPEITNSEDWKIVADCNKAGAKPFTSTAVAVFNGRVMINGACSAVLIKN